MENISFKQIDTVIAEEKRLNLNIYKRTIGVCDVNFEVVIQRRISFDAQIELIQSVFNSVFKDGKFNACAYDLIRKTALISYFTNIKTTAITPDRLMYLIYSTSLIENIEEAAYLQTYDITNTLTTMIDDEKKRILAEKKSEVDALRAQMEKEQREVMADLEKLTETFKAVGEKLKDVDIDNVLADMKAVAGKNERSLIDGIMERKAEVENDQSGDKT